MWRLCRNKLIHQSNERSGHPAEIPIEERIKKKRAHIFIRKLSLINLGMLGTLWNCLLNYKLKMLRKPLQISRKNWSQWPGLNLPLPSQNRPVKALAE